MLEIRPTHLKPAREFVGKYHRHNIPPVGGKFAISCFEGERLCGVAICGRPTARKLDDGATLEIYRNCTDGTRNACTKLYGACVRIARDMGYKKVITYTLESENGASLRAANFTFAGIGGRDRLDRDTPPRLLRIAGRNEKPMGICTLKGAAHMKDNKSGWQFPKALEIIKCKEGNKEFMKERPARRPFGNTVLICEYPIDDTAAEEPNAKLITWRLAKRAARDFLRVSFMPSAIVSAATHGGKTAVRVYGKY